MITITLPPWFIYLLAIFATIECVVAVQRFMLLRLQAKLEKGKAANELRRSP